MAVSSVARAQLQRGEYQVGPKDLIEIKVLEIPELNVDRRVSDGGAIDLPMLGLINVGGLSAGEMRDRLVALLTAKYVQHANVSVVIKDYAARPVWITGAVQKQGPLNISGRWDLQQAILAAGGLAPGAGKKIYVLRRSDNGLSDRLEINSDDLFIRSSPIWNIPIFPSDIVTVTVRIPVKISCIGEFKSPGSIEFQSEDRITLLSVIARAGGLSDHAARGSIRIKRRAADGKNTELVVDYKRIISGKDPDPDLQPDDVVIVKESIF
ncbi:MAG: polysaccharide biosynthesis/export family protein [Thermoanaerobaculia bacterium]